MIIFADTLRALAPLFFLMLLGAGLRRAGLIRLEHVPVLNGLVVNVTMPALVLNTLANAPAVPIRSMWLPLAVFIAQFIVMGVAWIAGRAGRWERPRAGALMLVGPYGNTGFLGYPIILALYPHHFTAAVLVDQLGMTIAMFTCAPIIGAFFAPGMEKGDTLKQVLTFFKSPIFITMLLAAAIRLAHLPPIVHDNAAIAIGKQCLTYLGQGTVPIVLLALGASLRPAAARAGFGPLALASGLKLAVMPLLVWGMLRYVGLDGDLLRVGVTMAGMPTAVMASVLTGYNKLDGDYAVGTVFVSTVLSAITMPLWMSVVK